MPLIHPRINRRSVRSRSAARRHQTGLIMVVAMLFALLILVLGVSTAATTIFSEKMAGNQRNHSLAFEAAQAAILQAEAHLNATGVLIHGAAPGGTGTGDYAYSDTSLPHGDPGISCYLSSFNWSANATSVTVTINGVAKTAYYVIETTTASLPTNTQNATNGYRITGYATGGSSDASALVQTTYIR